MSSSHREEEYSHGKWSELFQKWVMAFKLIQNKQKLQMIQSLAQPEFIPQAHSPRAVNGEEINSQAACPQQEPAESQSDTYSWATFLPNIPKLLFQTSESDQLSEEQGPEDKKEILQDVLEENGDVGEGNISDSKKGGKARKSFPIPKKQQAGHKVHQDKLLTIQENQWEDVGATDVSTGEMPQTESYTNYGRRAIKSVQVSQRNKEQVDGYDGRRQNCLCSLM